MKRGLGLLMHITSIKEDFGYGCFSKNAYSFVDFLSKANVKYWQILPINPTDEYGCPYSNSSFYAINPLLISLENFIDKIDIQHLGFEENMSYEEYSKLKNKALRLIYQNSNKTKRQTIFENENAWWLEDYSMFMALKNKYKNGISSFPKKILENDKTALNKFKQANKKEIAFQKFVQYVAYSQWKELKEYANKNGVEIIGDLPFSLSKDSDAYLFQRENFETEDGALSFVSGVPGDDFNKEGQVWGNPVYNVKYIKENDYKFLLDRFKHYSKMFDYLRVDHFRGYESFYKVPEGQKAIEGVWQKSFGFSLFKKLKQEGINNLILEDLGMITPEVERLKQKINLPGVKVVQFAFDGNYTNRYLPMRYEKNCVAYLGTHDNNTFCGFLNEKENKKAVREYLHLCENASDKQLTYSMMESIISSNADVVIVTPQDLLCQDEKFRMNTPGEVLEYNWKYVAPKKLFDRKIIEYLLATTSLHNR